MSWGPRLPHSYCLLSNHLHLLLEVPPGCEKKEIRVSDEELIHRLGGLSSRNHTRLVARELAGARTLIAGTTPEGLISIRCGRELLEIRRITAGAVMAKRWEVAGGGLRGPVGAWGWTSPVEKWKTLTAMLLADDEIGDR